MLSSFLVHTDVQTCCQRIDQSVCSGQLTRNTEIKGSPGEERFELESPAICVNSFFWASTVG